MEPSCLLRICSWLVAAGYGTSGGGVRGADLYSPEMGPSFPDSRTAADNIVDDGAMGPGGRVGTLVGVAGGRLGKGRPVAGCQLWYRPHASGCSVSLARSRNLFP